MTSCPTPAPTDGEVRRAIDVFIGPAPQRLIIRQESVIPLDRGSVVICFSPSRSLQRSLIRAGYPYSCEFSVLPNPEQPRWLLPVGSVPTMLSGLGIYTPFARRGRLLKASLAGAIAFGWKGWSRTKVLLAADKPLPLQAMVTEVTGEQRPVFAMSLGQRERFRALTVQIMRPTGGVLGYIKLPLTDAATQSLRHEAKVLTWLWNKVPRIRGHIPQVLHSGEWNGGFVLFQSSGPRKRGPNGFGRMHTQFLENLWQAQSVAKPGPVLVEKVAARWREIEPQLETEWRNLGQAALREAGLQLERTTVSCGVMHGDFAPWNTRQQDDRLFAFDWESARFDAPTLWDVFHFKEQVTFLLERKTTCYAPFGLTRTADNASLLLYRLHSVCEALEQGGPYLLQKINHQKRQISHYLQHKSSAHCLTIN